MQNTQLILLSAASLLILIIVGAALYKQSKRKQSSQQQEEENYPHIQQSEECEFDDHSCGKVWAEEKTDDARSIQQSTAQPEKNHLIVISIHARPHTTFSDYSFLQTLGSAGLIYGDHKIFHYDIKTDNGNQRLFSVAQLNKPGTFDIDHIETLHCRGLLFFIDLRACRKQTLALDCMLEAAYQIADDLDGIMYEGYNLPWQEDTPRKLAQQCEAYQKNTVSVLDEITC